MIDVDSLKPESGRDREISNCGSHRAWRGNHDGQCTTRSLDFVRSRRIDDC